jgi:hypothetical protein
VFGEGMVCALMRAVCTDLRGPAEDPDLPSCDGGFPQPFREQRRGFHDLLRQEPSYLFILLGLSSISIASLMMRSMYLGVVERMVVFCSWMRCHKLMLCSPTSDLSECSRRMCRWCSFNLVSTDRPVCPM